MQYVYLFLQLLKYFRTEDIMEQKFKEIISERGKPLLWYEQYKYCFSNTTKAGVTRWKCTKKNICSVSIYTMGDSLRRTVISQKGQHQHDPDTNVNRQIVSHSCKRKAADDISERPRKIVQRELKNLEEGKDLTNEDLECIKRNMYNCRRKMLPRLPRSISEVHVSLDNLQPKTSRNENFLLANDSGKNIIVFGTKTNLDVLCSTDIIYADGTFEYCPKYFLQLFTLHGYVNNNYVPLVFCLLKDKTEASYTVCLNIVRDICLSNTLNFHPKEIVLDFEISIHNAVQTIWDDIKITGCRFHLAQSWWKKIQNLGLSIDYKDNNSEIGMWLHYCFGMMFLDSNQVGDFFVFNLLNIQPHSDKLTKFSDYLVETYISEHSLFPPLIWAQTSAELNKTTNACESFHSHFNSSFYCSHPHIFYFLDVLQNIQTEIYIKINSLNTTRKSKNTKSVKKQRILLAKINELKNNQISEFQFVKSVAWFYAV